MQKAGVSKDKLSRLVLKELADNGLDTGARSQVGELPDGALLRRGRRSRHRRHTRRDRPPVQHRPPDGLDQAVAAADPWRLGNGLRVVAGAVLASEGSLTVITRNKRIELRPERDGTTTVVSVKPVKFPVGTRIEIGFGPALPCDDDTL